jgi:hypothetical protein
VDVLNGELQQAGVWVFAGGLEPPATATVVRASSGQIVTTDGPFAETKEQLGGFWIIDVPDLDVALDWAGQATVACGAPVEVRMPSNPGGWIVTTARHKALDRLRRESSRSSREHQATL